MKKFTLLFFMALSMFMTAQADNYFTIGVNDSLRLHPTLLGGTTYVHAKAHFEARLDYWFIELTYPTGFVPESSLLERAVTAGSDMTVSYTNQFETDTIYDAHLTDEVDHTILSSYIPVIGYYDYNNDGIMDPYGTVKWEAGDYDDMFVFRFYINTSFRSGYVIFDGRLDSGPDARGGNLNGTYYFYKSVYVYVGLRRGDVTGDNYVNPSDLTMLINYLNDPSSETLDEFQLVAADVNSDGYINVSDATALTNILLNT